MKVSESNRTAAAALLKRGQLTTVDELCLREVVACYDNDQAVEASSQGLFAA